MVFMVGESGRWWGEEGGMWGFWEGFLMGDKVLP